MTKSRTLAAALAALTLTAVAVTPAQAGPKWGKAAVIVGITTLAVGAAIAASRERVYDEDDCRLVERRDRFGEYRTVKVCEVD